MQTHLENNSMEATMEMPHVSLSFTSVCLSENAPTQRALTFALHPTILSSPGLVMSPSPSPLHHHITHILNQISGDVPISWLKLVQDNARVLPLSVQSTPVTKLFMPSILSTTVSRCSDDNTGGFGANFQNRPCRWTPDARSPKVEEQTFPKKRHRAKGASPPVAPPFLPPTSFEKKRGLKNASRTSPGIALPIASGDLAAPRCRPVAEPPTSAVDLSPSIPKRSSPPTQWTTVHDRRQRLGLCRLTSSDSMLIKPTSSVDLSPSLPNRSSPTRLATDDRRQRLCSMRRSSDSMLVCPQRRSSTTDDASEYNSSLVRKVL